MEAEKIKELMLNGTKICDAKSDDVLRTLKNQVTSTFIKNGVHRSMTNDAFQQEVAFCAQMLYADIMDDKLYSLLRDTEIAYIFSEGIKGRLGTDKDIVLTYKSLVRWIEGYAKHPIKRDAVEMFLKEMNSNRKQIPSKEITDDDVRMKIAEAYSDFESYKKSMNTTSEKVESDAFLIGEVISMPITCYDYGKIRMNYLLKNGFAYEGETLLDVFERAYSNGGKFTKISDI